MLCADSQQSSYDKNMSFIRLCFEPTQKPFDKEFALTGIVLNHNGAQKLSKLRMLLKTLGWSSKDMILIQNATW